MTLANKAIKYFFGLNTPLKLPGGVGAVNPFDSSEAKKIVGTFYTKYFKDDNKRLFVFGINPGRFGGGITGISFTDPVALREHCGIENNLGNKKELSSKFIYEMIKAFGGVDIFYSKIFLSALYPLALMKDGKNYNYYDDKNLFRILKPDIIASVRSQIEFGAKKEKVIILGRKNAEYFLPINEKYNFFNQVIVLDHPRYILQYKLRLMKNYISTYLKALG
ncbi:MAG: DUF4918 family protein [Ignavibacteriaceae bacterium]